jgi:adenine-specific DNA-methyltransferase
MYTSWKDAFIELKRFRRNLLDSIDYDLKSANVNTFINHFILQFFVLWILQKKLFFDRDEIFFKRIFKAIKENKKEFPYQSFYHFLIPFLEEVKTLDDFVVGKTTNFGELIGCNSAIFLDLEFFHNINSIPDEFFSKPPLHNKINRFRTEGILDLLDHISFPINGFFLGSLYEWLISSDKRKQSGIYYTPESITSFASKSSIRYFLEIPFRNLFQNNKPNNLGLPILSTAKLNLIKQQLAELTILDPAVGTGHFLESSINDLLFLYKEVWNQLKIKMDPLKDTWFINCKQKSNEKINLLTIKNPVYFEFIILFYVIFPETIYGVDISESAIMITKTRLFLILAERWNSILPSYKEFRSVQFNLKSADSLFLDWKSIYSDLFTTQEGFTIILTNPPYMGESDNKELFRMYARMFPEYYEGKLDLWYLFFHQALELLKPDGIVTILSSSYWLTASGASKLRKRVLNETYIMKYINFGNNKVFKSAQGVHTSLITVKNCKKRNSGIDCTIYNQKLNPDQDLIKELPLQLNFFIDQNELTLSDWDDYFHFSPSYITSILKKIAQHAISLAEADYYVKEGLITGLNKITRRQVKKYGYSESWVNNGVFILDLNNVNDQQIIEKFSNDEKKHVKPLYKNSDIIRYSTNQHTSLNLLYIQRKNTDISMTPNIAKHLENYRIAMENSLDHPPFINRPRRKQIFLSPKIVVPQRTHNIRFGYNCTEWFAGQDVYFILDYQNSEIKLKNLLAFLQSKLGFFWFSWMGKKKGSQFEFYGESLSYFPIPKRYKEDPLLKKIVDYLIFLYSIQDLSSEFVLIRNFFDDVVVNLLVYEHYFDSLILQIPNFTESLTKFRSFLEESLEEIQLEEFLQIRYKMNSSQMSNTQAQFKRLKNHFLQTIDQCYKVIESNQLLDWLNKQLKTIPEIENIDLFYFEARHS